MSHKVNEWWPEKKRIEVITTWLVIGNIPLVSAATGVPAGTIRQWRTQPWWKEIQQEIEMESDQELDAKLAKVVNKSLDQIVDRIDNGDLMYDPKTGTVIRKPVLARDLSKIHSDTFDKRMLLRKQPKEQVNQEAVSDILKNLANEFADMARKKLKEKVIDGEVYESEILDPHQAESQGTTSREVRSTEGREDSTSENRISTTQLLPVSTEGSELRTELRKEEVNA